MISRACRMGRVLGIIAVAMSAGVLLPAGGCLPQRTAGGDPLEGDAARQSPAREVLPGPVIMRPEWVWLAQGRDAAMAQVGTPAPDLQLAASDGSPHTVSFAELRGQSVVLYFWATWCNACKENMRALDERARVYGPDGVRFIGVCVDQGGEAMLRTARSNGMNWPTYHDRDAAAGREYDAAWYPYVVVVGPDGRIQASGLHLRHFDEAIGRLLSMPAS